MCLHLGRQRELYNIFSISRKEKNVHQHCSLIAHIHIRDAKTFKPSQERKSQERLPAATSASARPHLVNQDQFDTCSWRSVSMKDSTDACPKRRSFQVSFGVIASRHLSHRWLKACRGRWSILCYPLIRIIKLSQPAAHKWGILPAPPSCGDSLQIACDSPPDCAMIMLSLDAVIMMACNCWCALAAAQHPAISLSTCLCIYIDQSACFFFRCSDSAPLLCSSLSRPPRDSTRAPGKTGFTHVRHLHRTCGLLSI